MNFANVPQWIWILLGVGAVFFAVKSGWLDNLLKRPATGGSTGPATGAAPATLLSLLDGLQGYRTKLAALVLAVLAANEVWHFLPDQYLNGILYLASAGGLYFLRDAVERLKRKVDQIQTKS